MVFNLKIQLEDASNKNQILQNEFNQKYEMEKQHSFQITMKVNELEKQLTEACRLNEELSRKLLSQQQECDALRKEVDDLDQVGNVMKDTLERQQEQLNQWKEVHNLLQTRSLEMDRVTTELRNTKNDLDVKTLQLQKAQRELVALKIAKFDSSTQMNSYRTLLKSLNECDVLLWYFIENNLLALKEEGINKYITVTGSSNAKWIGIIEKCKKIPEYDTAIFGNDMLKFIICYKDQRMGFLDLVDVFIKMESKNMQRVVSDSVKLDKQNFDVSAAKMTYLLAELQLKIKNGTVPKTIDVPFQQKVDELRQIPAVS